MTGTDPLAAARAAGRGARRALSEAERSAATAAICHELLRLDELGPHWVGVTEVPLVGLYMAIDGEVDVTAVAGPLRERGWTICLPVVTDDDVLRFREWHVQEGRSRAGSEGNGLTTGRFGIPEPRAGGDDGHPSPGGDPSGLDPSELDPSELAVVVAPCTAVDGDGTRVGFGRGFYDRALGPAEPRPLVVVVAFDVQMSAVPLPHRAWDVPADVVVTDRQTYFPTP